MELRVFLSALRKFWWLILLVTLLGGGAGAAYAYGKTPVYASTVTFFAITPTPATGSPYAADQFAQQRVATYVDLLSSDRLAKLVLADPSIDRTVDQLTAGIDGSAKPATVLLTATVTDTDLNRSLGIAVAVSQDFPKLVQEIESDGGTKEALVGLTVVNGPSASPVPISPRTKLLIALGLVAGLVLGIALALLREVSDTTVRSVELLRSLTGVPVLGVITVDASARKAPLIVESNARSLRAESFRQLRTNLQFVDVEEPATVIVVTSSVAGEGKSTSAANLAIAFAESGRRVLLIDADLRRPKIAGYLGIEGSVGLTNVLAGQVDVVDVIQTWGAQSLQVLPSGSIPPNPSELLGSNQMDDLIALMRTRFDIVIIDTPPLLPVTDGAVAARHADGAVVVVQHGKTRRGAVLRSIETLRAVDARVLGTVLNRSPVKGAEAQNHYGQYGYAAYQIDEQETRTVSAAAADTTADSTGDEVVPENKSAHDVPPDDAMTIPPESHASREGASGTKTAGDTAVPSASDPASDDDFECEPVSGAVPDHHGSTGLRGVADDPTTRQQRTGDASSAAPSARPVGTTKPGDRPRSKLKARRRRS